MEIEHKQTENEYNYTDENVLDVCMFDGLIKLRLDTKVSNECVCMLRYF